MFSLATESRCRVLCTYYFILYFVMCCFCWAILLLLPAIYYYTVEHTVETNSFIWISCESANGQYSSFECMYMEYVRGPSGRRWNSRRRHSQGGRKGFWGERVWVMIFPIVFVVRPQFEETDLMALTKCVWAQWET